MTTLIVGCGYLGERVAKILLSRGETLYALTRRPERATELASLGITPLVGNWLDLESMPQLPEVDRLVVAVSHRPVEGLELERTHTAGLDSLLAKRTGVWKRAIYISTTGVYAQDGGVWVNEESACDPKRGGGVAALHGEKWFSQHFPQHISR